MNFADSVRMTAGTQEETKRAEDVTKQVISGDITYRDFTDIMAQATSSVITEVDENHDLDPLRLLLIATISADIVGHAWDLLVEEYGKDTEEE